MSNTQETANNSQEQFQYKAEVKQLLHLQREIFGVYKVANITIDMVLILKNYGRIISQ